MLGSSRVILGVPSGKMTGTMCCDADFFSPGGAPQVGFSAIVWKIPGRISFGVRPLSDGRPDFENQAPIQAESDFRTAMRTHSRPTSNGEPFRNPVILRRAVILANDNRHFQFERHWRSNGLCASLGASAFSSGEDIRPQNANIMQV